MKKILLSLTVITLCGAAGLLALNSSAIQAEEPKVAANVVNATNESQTRVFSIQNMTCAACPFTVKKAMSRVEGVTNVSVDFKAKTATAVFNPSLVKIRDIAAASTDFGYPATLIKEEL